MIKLEKIFPPPELDERTVKELTIEFIQKGAPVWNKEFIKEKLLEMSHGKCCYCECYIKEECKYLEVEHFLCKKKYKDDVVKWENLLPACKRCNSKKGELDVLLTPIIHPVNMDPREHIFLSNYRIKEKTEIGKNTWKELNLNDTGRVAIKRFEIGQKIVGLIEDIKDELLSNNCNEKFLRKVTRKIEVVLEECQPHKDYSATAATVLVKEAFSDYKEIKDLLVKNNKWTEELEGLEKIAQNIALT